MAMADLTGSYATALDQHLADPLVLAPLAMLDFLCIHPFPDGNGHMSRLLTLLLLYHFDYAVGRYISLERIFEDTKEGYYETLEASSQGWHQGQHDVKPWLDYFWGALLRAYREFEERVGTIERGRGSKGDRVRAEVLGRSQHRLQFHHIFPKAVLKTSFTAREADDIANLAFIGGKTNRAISDKAPAVYLPPLVDQLGEPAFSAQCIPVEASLLEVESYKAFLLERRKRIATALNTFVGPAD